METVGYAGKRMGLSGIIAMAVLAASWCVAAGCGEGGLPAAIPPDDSELLDAGPTTRIVSLAPALTQIIVDMGHDDKLVATAENDFAAPPGLPVVGNYLDINTEALLAVHPTYVLTMTDKDPVPPLLQKIAAGRFTLIAYPSPKNVADIMKIVFDETELIPEVDSSGKCLGAVLNAPRVALEIAMQMPMRLAQISSLTANAARPRVLMLISTQPMMASGPDTVLDQLLSFCGGVNAAGDATVGAPIFDKEKLVEANPDIILLLLPGQPPLGSPGSDPRLAQLQSLPVPAVLDNRIVLISDPLAHLPSTSLPKVAAQMAKAIHPSLADRIDEEMQSDPLEKNHPDDEPDTQPANDTADSPLTHAR